MKYAFPGCQNPEWWDAMWHNQDRQHGSQQGVLCSSILKLSTCISILSFIWWMILTRRWILCMAVKHLVGYSSNKNVPSHNMHTFDKYAHSQYSMLLFYKYERARNPPLPTPPPHPNHHYSSALVFVFTQHAYPKVALKRLKPPISLSMRFPSWKKEICFKVWLSSSSSLKHLKLHHMQWVWYVPFALMIISVVSKVLVKMDMISNSWWTK